MWNSVKQNIKGYESCCFHLAKHKHHHYHQVPINLAEEHVTLQEIHQQARLCVNTVLTRATRSPKFSRRGCFLQGSIHRGETFTVLVFKTPSRPRADTTLTATPREVPLLCLPVFFRLCFLFLMLSQKVLRQDTGNEQWESPWKDTVRQKIFDSSPWRIRALKAPNLTDDTEEILLKTLW